ncbi:trimeric intracellular cation channel family protein [Agilicoccus flavus]|uniref:trimeric intracellular cation channel family protein n=1 Tax=Agilicoccus flavus TaxID=2775968 RepID=UPI001CF6C467|nr:trimeric intracellular cation channel family protein [Agilicoccus flavus]
MDVADLMRVVDLVGVFANAVLGGVEARAARLDAVGFATLAILSGLGGGMIRDTLLQHGTPVALTDSAYVTTALVGAAVAYVIDVKGRAWDAVFPFVDAFALGCWAAAGAQKTLGVGLGPLPAVLLGTITAVGGGFVRDMILLRVPAVLGGNTLFATCALAASGVTVVGYTVGYPNAGLVAALFVGAGLCLLARWRGWVLPPGTDWARLRRVRARHAEQVRRLRRATLRRRRREARRARREGQGPDTPADGPDHNPR